MPLTKLSLNWAMLKLLLDSGASSPKDKLVVSGVEFSNEVLKPEFANVSSPLRATEI